MYYSVKLGEKTYYSKELVKHVRKLGDAGLLRETENGSISKAQVLSVTLFELAKEDVAQLDLDAMGVVKQDLTSIVETFCDAASVEESEAVTSARGLNTYTNALLGDTTFVELRTVMYARKYQIQEELPILDVCGVRFVAVNAVKKGCNKYISY